jgi:hypothetical protein
MRFLADPKSSSARCGLLGMPTDVYALCNLDGAVREQLRNVDDPEAVRALTQKIRLHATCSVCHFTKWGGPRNEYGSAINTLLTLSDRENTVRQRDAGRRMMDIPANPLLADSPTFGELFQQGRFPARSIETPMPPFDDVSATSRSGLHGLETILQQGRGRTILRQGLETRPTGSRSRRRASWFKRLRRNRGLASCNSAEPTRSPRRWPRRWRGSGARC